MNVSLSCSGLLGIAAIIEIGCFSICSPVSAQQLPKVPAQERPNFQLPQVPEAAKADLFKVHPVGDQTTTPCTHLQAEHAQGDPVPNRPCTHALAAQHADGDPVITPCLHLGGNGKPTHPGGHDTGKKVPCVHLSLPHPNGDPVPNAPCVHQKAQHPEGDPGSVVPCVHPMTPSRVDTDNGLVFFTGDVDIQTFATHAAGRLRALGVNVGQPRPLNIFHRPPIKGDPNDNKDPFWSHYNPLTHSIQLTQGRAKDALKETMFHEMGHATLGHSCVFISTKGGAHTMCDAADAALGMSEGWAHFIGMAILHSPSSRSPMYKGRDWEKAHTDTQCPYDMKSEFRVGAVLWDLYDGPVDEGKPDAVKLSFTELFKVYSPTLQTLQNGPIIPSLDNYLERLGNNNPGVQKDLSNVRLFNLSRP